MNLQQGKRPSYLAMVAETESRAELSPTDSDFPLTPADGSNHHIESSIHQRMQSQNSECSADSCGYPLESCKGLIEVVREDDDHIDLDEEERVWSSFESDSVRLLHLIKLWAQLLTSFPSFYRKKTNPSRPFITDRSSALSTQSGTPSVFSSDIWIGSTPEESNLFARGVRINGWTSVGDKKQGGSYVGEYQSFLWSIMQRC